MLRFAIALTLLTLSSSCTSTKDAHNSHVVEPSNPDMKVPKGWKTSSQQGFTIYTLPEGDTTIAMRTFAKGPKDTIASRAKWYWRQLVPGYNPKVKRTVDRLDNNGLGMVKVYFEQGKDKGRLRIAEVYRQKEKTLFVLYSLTIATYTKRRGQIGQFLKPLHKLAGEKPTANSASKPVDIAGQTKTIDRFITKAMNTLKVPGLAVGIIQNGKVVFQKAYGTKAAGRKDPVTLDTRFMIGSTSKTLTSLLAAKMVSDKRATWDEKVATYIPEWQGAKNPGIKDVTLQQSFCACTGLPRRDRTFLWQRKGVSAKDRINEMATWPTNAKMGELYQYSNHMIGVGGYAAARVYRPNLPLSRAYDQAMKDLVYKPLGMTSTVTTQSYPSRTNSASPHGENLAGEYEVIAPKYYTTYSKIAPAGSIWSTVPDMLKAMQLELSKGASVPGYIDAKELKLRHKPRTPAGSSSHYGLGMFVDVEDGRTRLGHGGNTSGFTSYYNFFPDDNWGYVILGNYGSFANFGSLIKGQIEYTAYGKTFDGDKYLKQVQEVRQSESSLAKDLMPTIAAKAELVGTYRSPELGTLRVFTRGKQLWADIGEYSAEMRELTPKARRDSRRAFTFVPPYAAAGNLMYHEGKFHIQDPAVSFVFNKVK